MKDRHSMTLFGTFAFISAVAAFAQELEEAEEQENQGMLNSPPVQHFGYDPSVQTVLPLNPSAPDPVVLNAAGKPETPTQKKARLKKEEEQAKKEAAEQQASNDLAAREQQPVMQNFNLGATPNPMTQPAAQQHVQQFEQQAQPQQPLQYTPGGHQVPQQGQFPVNNGAPQQPVQSAPGAAQSLPNQGWVSPGAVAPPVTFDSMYQVLLRVLNNPQGRTEAQQLLTNWGVTDINQLYGQGESIKSAYEAFCYIAQKFGA